ncbi:hypothetical protein K491DRAFT_460144 [Lophiostoma macrostomum CBS 122681]|uniref:Uncharacterized protein n=1 Tax=Lophiostoma macrostomum CBS 122681 TaxID=1314788 RepID=A0A6A6T842_9PLEO|nr:hypothetical protein K491DRAFT_460144 [Lophiostoma macrostomum CBS 122681]
MREVCCRSIRHYFSRFKRIRPFGRNSAHKVTEMCYRVVEKYPVCGCVYHVHAVDACVAVGHHPVVDKLRPCKRKVGGFQIMHAKGALTHIRTTFVGLDYSRQSITWRCWGGSRLVTLGYAGRCFIGYSGNEMQPKYFKHRAS